jgi:hypothetical protein
MGTARSNRNAGSSREWGFRERKWRSRSREERFRGSKQATRLSGGVLGRRAGDSKPAKGGSGFEWPIRAAEGVPSVERAVSGFERAIRSVERTIRRVARVGAESWRNFSGSGLHKYRTEKPLRALLRPGLSDCEGWGWRERGGTTRWPPGLLTCYRPAWLIALAAVSLRLVVRVSIRAGRRACP